MRFCRAIALAFLVAAAGSGAEPSTGSAPGAPPEKPLPPGFVRGDVVSRSYVPIRTWAPREGIGILPYLFEYNQTRP